MDIKQIKEEMKKVLSEKYRNPKRRLKEEEVICMETVVDDIVSRYEEEDKEDIEDIDSWVCDELQDVFIYYDDVVELYKEIASYDDNLYNEVSDAVWSHLYSDIMKRIEEE